MDDEPMAKMSLEIPESSSEIPKEEECNDLETEVLANNLEQIELNADDEFSEYIASVSVPQSVPPPVQSRPQPAPPPGPQPVLAPVQSGQPPVQSGPPVQKPVPTPSLPPLIKDWKTSVVSSQLFDGCWDTTGISKVLENRASGALSKNPHSDVKIWSTALAIAILELKCVDSKSTWEIVANKGRTYMSKILFGLEKKDKDEILQMVSDLIEKAKIVISTLI